MPALAWRRRPPAMPRPGHRGGQRHGLNARTESSDVLDEIAAAGLGVAFAGTSASARPPTSWSPPPYGFGWPGHRPTTRAAYPRPYPVHHERRKRTLWRRSHLRGYSPADLHAAVYWRNPRQGGDGTVYGRIINTSSEAGLSGPVGRGPNYGAAPPRRSYRAHGVGCPRPGALLLGQGSRTAGLYRNDRGRLRPNIDSRPAATGLHRHPPCDSWPRPRPKRRRNGQLFIVYGLTRSLVAPPTARSINANSDAWNPADLSGARCTITLADRTCSGRILGHWSDDLHEIDGLPTVARTCVERFNRFGAVRSRAAKRRPT